MTDRGRQLWQELGHEEGWDLPVVTPPPDPIPEPPPDPLPDPEPEPEPPAPKAPFRLGVFAGVVPTGAISNDLACLQAFEKWLGRPVDQWLQMTTSTPGGTATSPDLWYYWHHPTEALKRLKGDTTHRVEWSCYGWPDGRRLADTDARKTAAAKLNLRDAAAGKYNEHWTAQAAAFAAAGQQNALYRLMWEFNYPSSYVHNVDPGEEPLYRDAFDQYATCIKAECPGAEFIYCWGNEDPRIDLDAALPTMATYADVDIYVGNLPNTSLDERWRLKNSKPCTIPHLLDFGQRHSMPVGISETGIRHQLTEKDAPFRKSSLAVVDDTRWISGLFDLAEDGSLAYFNYFDTGVGDPTKALDSRDYALSRPTTWFPKAAQEFKARAHLLRMT